MRITSNGQVTIPAHIRGQAGPLPGTEVEFRSEGGVVSIFKAKEAKKASRGARLFKLRKGTRDVSMTTDEIMLLTRSE